MYQDVPNEQVGAKALHRPKVPLYDSAVVAYTYDRMRKTTQPPEVLHAFIDDLLWRVLAIGKLIEINLSKSFVSLLHPSVDRPQRLRVFFLPVRWWVIPGQ